MDIPSACIVFSSEFQFQIADDRIPNAFALPGGYVYVTRGLLALITTEDVAMFIHILWLNIDDHLFKLIGFAPKSLESDLQKTARSLRSLTLAERKEIKVRKLRIVKTHKNESIEELGERTNNLLNTTLTSVINGAEENEKLAKNQAVKIVVGEKYFKR